MVAIVLVLTLQLTLAYEAIEAKDGAICADAFQDAIEVNIRPECRDMLAPVVAAIRHAENGGKGREYGILHARVKPTYRSQAGWCAATVQKHYDWISSGSYAECVAHAERFMSCSDKPWQFCFMILEVGK